MPFSSFRGAIAAAAMMFASLLATAATAAPAHGTVTVTQIPIVMAAAANPSPVAPAPAISGSAWMVLDPATAQSAQPSAPATGAIPLSQIHAGSLMELVGDMPVPVDTAMTADMKCLAQAVYFESRGEPMEGQLAVAEVVINRAKSDLYPDSYCDVITQPAQFSFVHHGRIPAADESSEAWQRAVAIAEIAQQNLWQSKAADALYFHATYVNPSWARQKVELAQIDTHIFYR